MDVEDLAAIAVDCGLRVHKALGPGLLESVYEAALAELLMRRSLRVERQKMISIRFENLAIDNGFRADLLVEDTLILELKAVDQLAPIHARQLQTYLRLMDLRVGLLMNFNVMLFKDGVHRIANKYIPPASSPLRINQPGEAPLSSRSSRSSREPQTPPA